MHNEDINVRWPKFNMMCVNIPETLCAFFLHIYQTTRWPFIQMNWKCVIISYVSQWCSYDFFVGASGVNGHLWEGGARAPAPPGGGALDFQLVEVCAGEQKTGPCLKPLGARQIYFVLIHLTKDVHMHTLF